MAMPQSRSIVQGLVMVLVSLGVCLSLATYDMLTGQSQRRRGDRCVSSDSSPLSPLLLTVTRTGIGICALIAAIALVIALVIRRRRQRTLRVRRVLNYSSELNSRTHDAYPTFSLTSSKCILCNRKHRRSSSRITLRTIPKHRGPADIIPTCHSRRSSISAGGGII
jgi:hypothetical protein